MKDFENDLIYYSNPDPIEEPRFLLNSLDELEKSTKYSVVCNGTERVVYHTDSFDYVVVVDDEAYDLEISIHTPFEKQIVVFSGFSILREQSTNNASCRPPSVSTVNFFGSSR